MSENHEINYFTDPVLQKLVKESDIVPPIEKVEEEVTMMLGSLQQELKFGYNPQLQEEIREKGMEAYMEEVKLDAVRIVKTEAFLKAFIAEHDFPVSPEELEAEAIAISKRMDMSMDVVKAFLGDDFGSVKYDLQLRKAMEYIHANYK